jgi:pimeloyl-ACP methyl ester carboxylesterase
MSTTTITHQVVRAGSFDTTYLEAGPVDAPTIVLVHDGAYGASARLCWENVIPLLAEDHHVLAPDLLGFGGTDKAVFLDRSPYAFRVDHVAAWCEAVGVREADFVGSSFGGSLLLRAVVDGRRPWPIRRAMTICGTGGPFRLPSGVEALADYDGTLESARKLTGLLVRDMTGLEDHVARRLESSNAPGHWEAANAPRLHNPAVTAPAREDTFLDDLGSVDVPVVFVEGAHDVLLEKGWAQQLSNRTPGSTAVVGEFAHAPSIDQPGVVADLVRAHLA